MIRCLVIDDHPMARLAVRNLIEEVDFLSLSGECESALQAINLMEKQPADLLFLDVEMPQMSGLEMLESLTRKPLVILITSKIDYAAVAYDLEVIDYLVKPIQLARFLRAVQRARDILQPRRQDASRYIFIRIDNVLTRIDLDQILYVEAMGDYIRIVTTQKKYIAHLTLKTILDKLPEDQFIRVHRSNIVALNKIDSFADNMVAIQKTVLPVSESYRAALLEKLHAL